jgi:hypothetical protein
MLGNSDGAKSFKGKIFSYDERCPVGIRQISQYEVAILDTSHPGKMYNFYQSSLLWFPSLNNPDS